MGRIWARADGPEDRDARKMLVTRAMERGLEDIVVRVGDEEFQNLGRINLILNDGDRLITPSGILRSINITNPDDMDEVMCQAGKESFVVSTTDWKVIPLENLVAAFQGSGSWLVATADSMEEAMTFLATLEVGVDAVLVRPEVWDREEMEDSLRADDGQTLTAVTVTKVKKVGLADRVCVDTCSLMTPGEGMLIGSQSGCMLLIQSESEESGYVASRPFRVNAGAVHAYVLTPGGKTRYLSEIKSGDEVLVVNREGKTRKSVVGRCKTESRPMVMLELQHEGAKFTAMVQNAETVRLMTPDGSISVADVKEGDRVLAAVCSGGRHFGMSIDESIKET